MYHFVTQELERFQDEEEDLKNDEEEKEESGELYQMFHMFTKKTMQISLLPPVLL